MDKEERLWFGILILAALLVNALTLSPLVPWQRWLVWSRPEPQQWVFIEMGGEARIDLPAEGVQVKRGEYVEFVATSLDVTYGFGVFRPDGTLVFQMQVVPGHDNRLLWKFDQLGHYDVRSTEYSGPGHNDLFFPRVLEVIG